MSALMVASERLGELSVDEMSVVELPAGIIGFPEYRRYALVAADEDGLYTWLQSLDEPSLAFLAVVPTPFFADYAPVIADEDCFRLGLGSSRDAQLLCLVTLAEQSVTANLLGPIVLNVRTRTARQVVLNDPRLSTRMPIVPG